MTRHLKNTAHLRGAPAPAYAHTLVARLLRAHT
jgi:hypothetical protein